MREQHLLARTSAGGRGARARRRRARDSARTRLRRARAGVVGSDGSQPCCTGSWRARGRENSISNVGAVGRVAVLRVRGPACSVAIERDPPARPAAATPARTPSRRRSSASATSAVIVCVHRSELDAAQRQQVVERRALDVGPAETSAPSVGRAPTRSRARTARRRRGSAARPAAPRRRRARPSASATAAGAGTKPNSRTRRLGRRARGFERGLDRS